MFPLVLVLGLGVFDGDARSARYALPLAWAGLSLALYHFLLFWGVISEAASPCQQGVSCADAELQVAGVVPIPLLSLLAFTAILVLLSWHRKKRGSP